MNCEARWFTCYWTTLYTCICMPEHRMPFLIPIKTHNGWKRRSNLSPRSHGGSFSNLPFTHAHKLTYLQSNRLDTPVQMIGTLLILLLALSRVHCIRDLHNANAINRGVVQFNVNKVYSVIRSLSRNHAYLRTPFYRASAVAASPVLATVGMSVRLSVRPSVRPSHADIVWKRRKLGSRNLHRRIAQRL